MLKTYMGISAAFKHTLGIIVMIHYRKSYDLFLIYAFVQVSFCLQCVGSNDINNDKVKKMFLQYIFTPDGFRSFKCSEEAEAKAMMMVHPKLGNCQLLKRMCSYCLCTGYSVFDTFRVLGLSKTASPVFHKRFCCQIRYRLRFGHRIIEQSEMAVAVGIYELFFGLKRP